MNKHLNHEYLKNDKEVLDFINGIYKKDDLLNNMLLKLPEEEFREFVLIILESLVEHGNEYLEK